MKKKLYLDVRLSSWPTTVPLMVILQLKLWCQPNFNNDNENEIESWISITEPCPLAVIACAGPFCHTCRMGPHRLVNQSRFNTWMFDFGYINVDFSCKLFHTNNSWINFHKDRLTGSTPTFMPVRSILIHMNSWFHCLRRNLHSLHSSPSTGHGRINRRSKLNQKG